jgi:hypothetical protein
VDNLSGNDAIRRMMSRDHHHPEAAMTRQRRLARIISEERGDVPGWVLITLMTAGLVIIIWGLAGPALSSVFERPSNA